MDKNGNEEISLTEHSIKNVRFTSHVETELNLRHSRITKDITLTGLINAESSIREVKDLLKLADFAIIPEFEDCYKDVDYIITDSTGRVVREGSMTDAYVVEFKEGFSNNKGVGEFKVTLRERYKPSLQMVGL